MTEWCQKNQEYQTVILVSLGQLHCGSTVLLMLCFGIISRRGKKRKRFIFCVGELVPLHVITNWIIRFGYILSHHSGWLSLPPSLDILSIFIIIMVCKRKCITLFKKCPQAWYCNFTQINFQTKNKLRFYLLSPVAWQSDCIWSPFHVFLQDKSGKLQEKAESISTFGIHRK